MNVSIRRQGINIKTIPVNKDRVRVGSGADCEIQLTDPFLAPVVAEFVHRGGEWYLVDSGTSLEGITRSGIRVIDEPVEPGQSYAVGAFELITNANQNRIGAATSAGGSGKAIPMTMVEADLRAIPRTVVESIPRAPEVPHGAPRESGSGQRIVFQPVVAAAPAMPSSVSPQRGTSVIRRILLIAVVVALTIVIGLAVILSGRKPARRVSPAASTAPVTATTKPVLPVPAAPAPDGDALARKLEIEKAFAAWESELSANPSASPELRRKVANGAFELARAYAAVNDRTSAARYFEIVIRHGQPDSAQVREARARLQR